MVFPKTLPGGVVLDERFRVYCLGDEREFLVLFGTFPVEIALRLFVRYMVEVENVLNEDAWEIANAAQLDYREVEVITDEYYPDDWFLSWADNCKPNCVVTMLDRE